MTDFAKVVSDRAKEDPAFYAALMIELDVVPAGWVREFRQTAVVIPPIAVPIVYAGNLNEILPEHRSPEQYAASPAGRLAKLIAGLGREMSTMGEHEPALESCYRVIRQLIEEARRV